MKKLLSMALVLALAAVALAEPYTIYLITMDLADQHWVAVDEGARAAVAEAKAAGTSIRYIWYGPTIGKDDQVQIQCIESACADGADVILLSSNGPDTQVPVIEAADRAGVKFVYVDSPANSDVALCTLSTDNVAAGRIAGETLLEALTEAGVYSGKIGIVNVNAATVTVVNRELGFRSAFQGTPYEILEARYSEGDPARSQALADELITEGCAALFGANEGCTVGVGNAIGARTGSRVLGIGFDRSDAILNLVAEGKLIATIAQNPYAMGYEGIKVAVDYLTEGTTGFEDVDTGVSVMTADAILENNLAG